VEKRKVKIALLLAVQQNRQGSETSFPTEAPHDYAGVCVSRVQTWVWIQVSLEAKVPTHFEMLEIMTYNTFKCWKIIPLNAGK
jgi:hypothetical protein